ncbi:MAG: hypothetical protein ACOCYE_11100 [Pseudomonadota bacterium]
MSSAKRLVLVTDRSDAPVETAVRVARAAEMPLDVVMLAEPTWRYAGYYGDPRRPERPPTTGAGERVALRQLEQRLARATHAGELRFEVQLATDDADLTAITADSFVLLARPGLLGAVAEHTPTLYLPGPGRVVGAAIVAFAAGADRTSVVLARHVARANCRRFALVELDTSAEAELHAEAPLWTQRWAASGTDLGRWLGAAAPAGLVLPTGSVRRAFADLLRSQGFASWSHLPRPPHSPPPAR